MNPITKLPLEPVLIAATGNDQMAAHRLIKLLEEHGVNCVAGAKCAPLDMSGVEVECLGSA